MYTIHHPAQEPSMLPLQKLAWFNLAVFRRRRPGLCALCPLIGPHAALGAFGLCGLWGLGGIFIRRAAGRRSPCWTSATHALRAPCSASAWSFLGVLRRPACHLGGVTYVRGGSTVPVELLPWLVMGGMIVLGVTQSVALLAFYGWSPP